MTLNSVNTGWNDLCKWPHLLQKSTKYTTTVCTTNQNLNCLTLKYSQEQ